MNITMDELMRIIGALFVENTMLRKEIEALRAQLAKEAKKDE